MREGPGRQGGTPDRFLVRLEPEPPPRRIVIFGTVLDDIGRARRLKRARVFVSGSDCGIERVRDGECRIRPGDVRRVPARSLRGWPRVATAFRERSRG